LNQTLNHQRNRFEEKYRQPEPSEAPPGIPFAAASKNNVENELEGLSEQEIRRMTRIDGWSERELRALARIRRQQQKRKIAANRLRQQRCNDRSNYSQRSNSQHRSSLNTIPREDDMLFYANPDSFVNSMNDVFLLSGDDPSFNFPNHHLTQNPFENDSDYNNDSSFTGRTTVITDGGRVATPSKPSNTTESSSNKLKRLTRYVKERDSKEVKTCSICLDEITSKRDKRILKCAHTFHRSCVGEWLARSIVCPLCRTEQ
jgi:hypothetical protein